jgi:acetyl-CoA C-acetyltransferase
MDTSAAAAGAAIIGWAHTPFGRLEEPDAEGLVARVAGEALAHARVAPEEVGAIFVGHFNGGFQAQDFPASLVMQSVPGLRFARATRYENACASGSAALYGALDWIGARRGRVALVLGVEKMTSSSPEVIARTLLKCAYLREEATTEAGFAGIFAQIARAYFQRHGDASDALAAIAAKNHANGVANPYAQLRKDLGFAFCRAESERNPMVAAPLKRTDCSPVSDGAAALVLAEADAARAAPRAVHVRAAVQVNDLMPLSARDMSRFDGAAMAWGGALAEAGWKLSDLHLVETHDCFTIAELMQIEAMGLAGPGEGPHAVLEGWTQRDGRLPVNASGGLKAKGHPIGATGVSMHVMAAMQLAGEAGAMQLPRAGRAGVFNMGGAGVANYATLLEAAR